MDQGVLLGIVLTVVVGAALYGGYLVMRQFSDLASALREHAETMKNIDVIPRLIEGQTRVSAKQLEAMLETEKAVEGLKQSIETLCARLGVSGNSEPDPGYNPVLAEKSYMEGLGARIQHLTAEEAEEESLLKAQGFSLGEDF